MSEALFFNAHHSPIGAFASLTLGMKGGRGGLGIELGGPANRPVYVGIEEREKPGEFLALPFYSEDAPGEAGDDYDVEGLGNFHYREAIKPFKDAEISRRIGPCIDEWTAGDLTFRIASPVREAPDPADRDEDAMRAAFVPALAVELTLDNRTGKRTRKAFFGYDRGDGDHAMRIISEPGLTGVAQGFTTAIATGDEGVYAGLAFQPEAILMPRHSLNLGFMLGTIGLLVGEVEAGDVRTFRFAVGFFREGTATAGIETRYFYRRWFGRVEDVVRYALSQADGAFEEAIAFDNRLLASLSPERGLMLSQAIRSYYGSTQLLERCDGRPIWVVNEGEYRMMNTFDLTVDQAFFELALNPWTLRNELDLFVERYAYVDRVRLPNDEALYEGGLAFTHDMGVANCFSEPGTSCYEQAGLRGCFSYMSSEELVNWAISATLYVDHTDDEVWLRDNARIFESAVRSLVNRDHPDPEKRTGIIGLDGARCEGGSEITTYDSLDASLGQARSNLYLAVKSWAAYVLLGPMFARLERPDLEEIVAGQAALCAGAIVGSVDEEGLLPAIIGEGIEARIIPAIEGLVYPWLTGHVSAFSLDGPFGDLRSALARHFETILESGACRFADGGWRLSSTSRNSWLSKIYLCQAVSENVLGNAPDRVADRAHLSWLLRPDNAYYAWSDQMLEGKAVGSRYYPRGVTGILWLSGDHEKPVNSIRRFLLGELASAETLVPQA